MFILNDKKHVQILFIFIHFFFTYFVPVISIIDSPIYDRFFYTIRFGYHDNHPEYESDLPRSDQYHSKIPFGLPAGFLTARGRGPPVGLLAYVIRFGSSSGMWKKYYADNEPYLMPIYRRFYKL